VRTFGGSLARFEALASHAWFSMSSRLSGIDNSEVSKSQASTLALLANPIFCFSGTAVDDARLDVLRVGLGAGSKRPNIIEGDLPFLRAAKGIAMFFDGTACLGTPSSSPTEEDGEVEHSVATLFSVEPPSEALDWASSHDGSMTSEVSLRDNSES